MNDLFFNDNPLPMWICDSETNKFLEANEAARECYGYSIDEFKSMSLKDLLPPDEVESRSGNTDSLIGEIGKTITKRHLKKNGTVIHVKMVSRRIEFAGRMAIFVTAIDDTEHIKTEEDLRESQARLASMVDTAMDAIICVDQDHHIMLFNSAAEAMFQYPSEQVLGQHVESIIPKRYRLAYREHISNLEEADKTNRMMGNTGIVYGLRKNGDEFPVEASISYSGFSRSGCYTVILRDISERIQAEEKLQRQLKRLNSLREIDRAITSNYDIHITLKIALQQVVVQLNVNAAAILLFDSHMQTMRYASHTGFHSKINQYAHLRLGEGHAGRVILERRMIHIPDLRVVDDSFANIFQLTKESFIDYFGVPLVVKGEIKGVLEVYHRSVLNHDADWLEFLNTLATQIAIAVDSGQLFDSLQQSNRELELAYEATIAGWSHALDLRDKETEGHTQRVTEKALDLARRMGVSNGELVHIRRGGLLHDIGKMGVPDEILFKAGALTEQEWEVMKKHPVFAKEMLSPIHYLKPADIDIPYCHHEKWDGTGYPRGLQGEQIPLIARIFAVVDVWDAVTSDRPYRAAWSKEKAVDYIKEQSGKHFDPLVVDAFLSILE